MKKAILKTRTYVVLIVAIFLTGAIALCFTSPFLFSSIKYYFTELSIKEAEAEAEQYGWTDYRTEVVDELKEERTKNASEDEVFAWNLDSSRTHTAARIRNAVIFGIAICWIIGAIFVVLSIYTLIREVKCCIMKVLNVKRRSKHEEETEKESEIRLFNEEIKRMFAE